MSDNSQTENDDTATTTIETDGPVSIGGADDMQNAGDDDDDSDLDGDDDIDATEDADEDE